MEFSCNSLLSGFILCLATKMCMELFGTILVFLITFGLFFSLIKETTFIFENLVIISIG